MKQYIILKWFDLARPAQPYIFVLLNLEKLYIYFEPASIAPYLDGEMHFEMPFKFENEKITVTPKHNGVAQEAIELDLGTCWCGFAQSCFKILPKLSKMVDIPDNYKPVYVMLLGKSAVKYPRTTIPENFPISEIKCIEDCELNWKQKIKRIFSANHIFYNSIIIKRNSYLFISDFI